MADIVAVDHEGRPVLELQTSPADPQPVRVFKARRISRPSRVLAAAARS